MDIAPGIHALYTEAFPSFPVGRDRLRGIPRLGDGTVRTELETADGRPAAACVYNREGILSALDLTAELPLSGASTIPPLPGDIRIGDARPDNADAVLRCVKEIERAWVPHYRNAVRPVLVARHGDKPVGCVMPIDDIRLSGCFPGKTGGIACLGVLPAYRERGIGLQLAAAAARRLWAEGCLRAYVGYTWLEEWYGRLGFRRFLSYWMGEKELP